MGQAKSSDGRLLADRYRLGEVLGKGGMGTVWRASDETLGRTVAVKELRFPGNVDEDEKRRLVTRTLREAKATARIRNTGAITVFDVVEEDDRPWIVMELVEGRSLSDAIREDGPLTPKRAAEVGLTVLDVLKAAHKEGILHRDVKPSNVLIADDGRVVLSDFGIAQIDGDPSVTSTGMLVGAPSYISPERARGQKPGPPADLWSLGALLYASVEGRPPYDKGSAIATLTAVMTAPIGPMANAGSLEEAIRGLLIKDPAQRLDDAGARELLTRVANEPDRPVAPAADPTRTVALPIDPQPTPTDAPADAREAAADQARVRGALRSMRNAATARAAATAKPKPKPKSQATSQPKPEPRSKAVSPAGSEPRPDASPAVAPPARITDVIPRRVLVIAIAVVVLAVLGTVIGVMLAGDDGSGSKSMGAKGAKPSGPAAAHSSTAPPGSQSGKGGQPAGDGKPSSGSSPSGSSSTGGTAGQPPSSGSSDGGAVPAGFYLYKDSEGFSIALPEGWKRIGDNGYGSGSKFRGPDGRELLVDWTHEPGKSALKDWQDADSSAPDTMSGYHRIALAKASYRTYDAADWEYERSKEGTPVHVLNRGFVVDSGHGYAIMFTTPAGEWNSDTNRKTLETFFATFKPAK